MKLIDKAKRMNIDGMEVDAIRALHCPSWYGMPNIEGCPKVEKIKTRKGKLIINYSKALEKCFECWNRDLEPSGSGKPKGGGG